MNTAAITRATMPVMAPRPEKDLAPKTERTEAPREKTVRPAVEVRDLDRAQAKRRALEVLEVKATEKEREVVTRDDARGTIFRVSDRSSGAIVYQIPSEEALKLRAYRDAQDRAREDRAREERVLERERDARIELRA